MTTNPPFPLVPATPTTPIVFIKLLQRNFQSVKAKRGGEGLEKKDIAHGGGEEGELMSSLSFRAKIQKQQEKSVGTDEWLVFTGRKGCLTLTVQEKIPCTWTGFQTSKQSQKQLKSLKLS